ncbi:GFA family protein [Terrarubrum flagellatum]|uniref:GFA family protein n=1 Tax=Terrirubrum flagellatum TaxID=2895980 RepID=UPI003145016F
MKQIYSGGCQCGAVRYEADVDIDEVISCNCSRCGRLGTLLAFTGKSDFRLTSGEGATTEYLFNKHVIHHLFCATCGVESFAMGKRPDGAEMIAVNARCLDGVDPDSLKIKKFDGKNLR